MHKKERGWMTYLLDTDICIYIMNKRPAEVIARFKQYDVGDVGISTITLSELQLGVAKSSKPQKSQQRLADFTAPFSVLSYDEVAAKAYGDIRYQLEKQGQSIGPLDLLIAAQAKSRKLVLVTNNGREFTRVDDLDVENWAAGSPAQPEASPSP
jgi:tRNA(fMet)-specific endonuclease VapC